MLLQESQPEKKDLGSRAQGRGWCWKGSGPLFPLQPGEKQRVQMSVGLSTGSVKMRWLSPEDIYSHCEA